MTDIEENIVQTTSGFAKAVMGLDLYDWQAKAVLPLEKITGSRQQRINITVCAPNSSGKDSHIIPVAAYYWLTMFPKGRVVITSKSDLQIDAQTIPALNRYYVKFGYDHPIKSPRYELTTPEGGQIIAFVTNDPSRAEGWHTRDDSPLLMIVNEAKSVDESIYTAIDGRCRPDVLMLVSSPGLMQGRFFETHTKLRSQWVCVQAGLADCPHITKEETEHILQTYGENHPVTRSTLYGEFMQSDTDDPYVLTREQVLRCIETPPSHLPGFRYGFFDFADGRAENVLVVRDGNKYEIADAWREQNMDAVVGRAIHLLRKHGLQQGEVGADAAAKPILDALAQAGWILHRQSFGAPVKFDIYKSWMAWAWLSGAQKIVNREVILPRDDVLIEQLTTRRKEFTIVGKISIEEKYHLQKRGIKSPDRADALFGCMSAVNMNLFKSQYKQTFDVVEPYRSKAGYDYISVGL